MVWTPPVRPLRSDTKVPANSIANTAVSSANHRCGTFGPFARRAHRRWTRSLIGKTPSDRDSFREAPLKSNYRNVAVPGPSAIRNNTHEREVSLIALVDGHTEG